MSASDRRCQRGVECDEITLLPLPGIITDILPPTKSVSGLPTRTHGVLARLSLFAQHLMADLMLTLTSILRRSS